MPCPEMWSRGLLLRTVEHRLASRQGARVVLALTGSLDEVHPPDERRRHTDRGVHSSASTGPSEDVRDISQRGQGPESGESAVRRQFRRAD